YKSYVEYKWNDETDYHRLVNIESLVGFQVRINPDNNNLEWKCADDEEWNALEYNGSILNGKTLDVTPAIIGPTVGGI
ncbi:MAG: hypothetical protein K2O22_01120, partial [Anaeroplasmataceae bacterium]|nr:hypothetical protein [Anaeroplasmataceae bacterium]